MIIGDEWPSIVQNTKTNTKLQGKGDFYCFRKVLFHFGKTVSDLWNNQIYTHTDILFIHLMKNTTMYIYVQQLIFEIFRLTNPGRGNQAVLCWWHLFNVWCTVPCSDWGNTCSCHLEEDKFHLKLCVHVQ